MLNKEYCTYSLTLNGQSFNPAKMKSEALASKRSMYHTPQLYMILITVYSDESDSFAIKDHLGPDNKKGYMKKSEPETA